MSLFIESFPFRTAFGSGSLRIHAIPSRNESPASKYDCPPCDPLDRPCTSPRTSSWRL
ncbi:MAG: hypothetical protein OXG81_13335 [Acidobacteria bacterium]|nr:hypothetical protein [Acidobacteriota bacterium]